jgi:hypothetical protein
MSFDISRSTFDPTNDFLGVVMQQGRVLLDADWNEWVAELTRRLQAGTLDILGRAVYPDSIPNSFKITPSLGGDAKKLAIGRGRMYVDGLLIENHGPKDAKDWDPALSELFNSQDLDYAAQPYIPDPKFSDTPDGPYLVYLDVWQREVTYLEFDTIPKPGEVNPTLVDKAVGVDTTGRLQTRWQVRLLALSGPTANLNCSSPLSDWGPFTQPSAGLLSNSTASSANTDDLCNLAPTGGYTGLENQYYRVEIHQPGSAQQATFKWSRDNASVATAVLAITTPVTNQANQQASRLTVASMGRDQVLGFNVGDWIELTDDYLEFAGNPDPGNANGQAMGELYQIDSVDFGARTITLNAEVTNHFPNGSTVPESHTRIRRWDGKGKQPIPPLSTSVELEKGIFITFDLTDNGTFKSGDFWTFAARTADGKVEPLSKARPRGRYHHFAPLALVTYPVDEVQHPTQSCRVSWQPTSFALTYVGGDGQEAEPNGKLLEPLEVAVSRGGKPLQNATVGFYTTDSAKGTLNGQQTTLATPLKVQTGPDGIAKCTWVLDTVTTDATSGLPFRVQQVAATLFDPKSSQPSIHFNGSLSLMRFSYVGGDGQVARGMDDLPAQLEVAVYNDYQPASPERLVQFTILDFATAKGTLSDSSGHTSTKGVLQVPTVSGIGACNWTLEPNPKEPGKTQTVEARLLDANKNPILQPVHFHARADRDPVIAIQDVKLQVTDGPLQNNGLVLPEHLNSGIVLSLDPKPAKLQIISPATCYVSVELPISFLGEFSTQDSFAFLPNILQADVTYNVGDGKVTWKPTNGTAGSAKLLQKWISDDRVTQPVLARLMLLGNFIWSDDPKPTIYLDGDSFGSSDANAPNKLRLPIGDGRSGGDFRMWFWLWRATILAEGTHLDSGTLKFGSVSSTSPTASGHDETVTLTYAPAHIPGAAKPPPETPITPPHVNIVNDQSNNFKLKSQDIQWQTAPDGKSVKGSVTITFKPMTATEHSATLRITGDQDVDFLEIKLSGTGA